MEASFHGVSAQTANLVMCGSWASESSPSYKKPNGNALVVARPILQVCGSTSPGDATGVGP